MKDRRLGWILALALCLGFASMEARSDGAPRADQQFFAQLRSEAASKPVARRPAKPSGVTGEKAYCEAQCGGGTKVWVNCSGGCSAVDRSCPSQQGYAQCNGGSPVYCPSDCEETCIAWTNCPGGGYVQCEGTTCDSFGHIMCNVMCDGYHYFCPGHFGEELC